MKFFNIVNHNKADESAVIQIMDEIGYDWWTDKGVEAIDFINEVRALGELKKVLLELNSPGGNVYDGVSIANFIKSHSAEWTAIVIGQAASIATVIASACDTIEMGVGTNYLVHKPMSGFSGYVNADECRALAQDLDTIENSVIDFYLPRIEASGKTKEQLLALMKEDRYMSPQEAIEWGFVDSQAVDIKAVAFVDAKRASQAGTLEKIVSLQKLELESLKSSEPKNIVINFKGATSDLHAEELAELLKECVEGSDFTLVNSKDLHKPADAEFIAKACADVKASNLINGMIESKLSKDQVTKQLNTVTSIQTVCIASKIDHEPILKNLADPAAMLSHAIAEVVAQSEQEQDASQPSGMDESKPEKLNSKAIFKRRNQRR